jgi:O-antigen ligase
MDAAYNILPSIMFLIYTAFEKKKLRYCLIAVLAGATAFIYGTRGPILCILVFLAVSLLQLMQKKLSLVARVAILAVIGGSVFLLIFSDTLITVAETLSEQFAKWGFSTRIFDYYIEGDMTEGSGRDTLFEGAIAAIQEKPFIGHGLLGDQVLLGNYVHNLFLELWMQFGIVFGTGIMLYFVTKPLMALYNQRKDKDLRQFIWMLICMNFVKLMVSSTYTSEQMFFFMLGICIAASHRQQSQSMIVENALKNH